MLAAVRPLGTVTQMVHVEERGNHKSLSPWWEPSLDGAAEVTLDGPLQFTRRHGISLATHAVAPAGIFLCGR